jgi:hypothetical protein
MGFTKHQVKQIREAVREALAKLEDELSVRFTENGTVHFTSQHFVLKVECDFEDAYTTLQTKDELDWNRLCYRYGLSPEDRGKIITMNDKKFKLIGIKSVNKKYPIIGSGPGGRRTKMPAKDVLKCLQDLD